MTDRLRPILRLFLQKQRAAEAAATAAEAQQLRNQIAAYSEPPIKHIQEPMELL